VAYAVFAWHIYAFGLIVILLVSPPIISHFESKTVLGVMDKLLVTSIALTLALVPTPAHANAGLPMLVVVWPTMWVLLLPIVLVEAAVAMKVLSLDFLYAAQIAGIANLVSTLVGLPITWFLLLIVELKVGKGGGAYGIDTLKGRLLSTTLQSPWLLPYKERWLVPAAALFLCIPFFFMSVGSEFVSARWFAQNRFPLTELLKWSWVANGLSYGMIACVLVFMLLQALRNGTASPNRDETKDRGLFPGFVSGMLLVVAVFGAGLASFVVRLLGGPPKNTGTADDKLLFRAMELHCSFCAKPQSLTKKTIGGPGVYICDACVEKAASLISNREVLSSQEGKTSCEFCGQVRRGRDLAGFSNRSICRDCIQLSQEIIREELGN
jgi:hypothetical protein